MNDDVARLRLYKFQVVPICQALDEKGRVVGERAVTHTAGAPVEVFGLDGLARWAAEFEQQIDEWRPPQDKTGDDT